MGSTLSERNYALLFFSLFNFQINSFPILTMMLMKKIWDVSYVVFSLSLCMHLCKKNPSVEGEGGINSNMVECWCGWRVFAFPRWAPSTSSSSACPRALPTTWSGWWHFGRGLNTQLDMLWLGNTCICGGSLSPPLRPLFCSFPRSWSNFKHHFLLVY